MKNLFIILSILFLTSFISCEDEPIGAADINMDLVDDELLNFMLLISDDPSDSEYNCIEFQYSFTLFVFDEGAEFEEAFTVTSNSSFLNLLSSIEENQSISLSYPIRGTLNNGEMVDINTNEELYIAIKECSLLEEQRRCNNTLTEEDCSWVVKPVTDAPNDFEGSIYALNNDGTVSLYNQNTIVYGTWITLYIGEELYLNIDLIDNPEAETFWDHNWEVVTLTDEQITIQNENNIVSIEKVCDTICEIENFEACELDDTPGFAIFDLSKFIPCIKFDTPEIPVEAVTFNFFETKEDAVANTNAINAFEYTNIENPQTIWVRIFYSTSGALIEITSFIINPIICTEE